MKDKETVNEYVKYQFNEQEKSEIAQEMARKVGELQAAEDEKKAIVSDFKSRIDGLQAAVNDGARKLNNGYEMRQVECQADADYQRKIWIIRRLDTMEVVREKKMTSDDLQLRIDD